MVMITCYKIDTIATLLEPFYAMYFRFLKLFACNLHGAIFELQLNEYAITEFNSIDMWINMTNSVVTLCNSHIL